MKKIRNYVSRIVFVSILMMLQLPCAKTAQPEEAHSRYLFLQQLNDMCTIAPMFNWDRLQKLKEKKPDGAMLLDASEFALTRQQWFGESYQYFFAWRKCLTLFMQSEAGSAYLTGAANDGFVTPHFYLKKGDKYIKADSDFIEKIPYFFADLNFQGGVDSSTFFRVPIVHEKIVHKEACNSVDEDPNGWLVYNQETKRFEQFTKQRINDEPYFASIKASLLPKLIEERAPLPIFICVTFSEGQIGFNSFVMPHQDWTTAYAQKAGDRGKMPYCLGFLRLMFLALGLNNANNPMEANDVDYPACEGLRGLIAHDKQHNPWSEQFFQKDYFLQYAIAEIFKSNEELRCKAECTVDFTGAGYWPTYFNLVTGQLKLYKNEQGGKYNPHEFNRYLPGREQALAYFFTQALRYLWYGAASKNAAAFYKSLQLQNVPLILRWWKNVNFSKIKRKATAKRKVSLEKNKDIKISFLDVWSEIKIELMKKTDPQKPDQKITDWVSFDDHGWVVSFDQDLIDWQALVARHTNGCDEVFLDKLGFAGIESWMSRELEVFYKNPDKHPRPKNEVKQLEIKEAKHAMPVGKKPTVGERLAAWWRARKARKYSEVD